MDLDPDTDPKATDWAGVVFCPHPPAIIPELASGAAGELAGLRLACRQALDRGLRQADAVVLLGGGDGSIAQVAGAGSATSTGWVSYAPWARASVMGYGGSSSWCLDPAETTDSAAATDSSAAARDSELPTRATRLPLSLAVGAWLLDQAGFAGRRLARSVDPAAEPAACRSYGRRLIEDVRCLPRLPNARAPRVLLLALADGSASRSPGAPRGLHPAAAPFDAAVAAAILRGDPSALLRLDRRSAAEVSCSGWAVWQTVAAVARPADMQQITYTPRPATTDQQYVGSQPHWQGDLLFDDAPFGVGYLVGGWQPALE